MNRLKLLCFCAAATFAIAQPTSGSAQPTASTVQPKEGSAQPTAPSDVPDSIYVGGKMFHVQGLAIDRERGYMYFSFTSQFYKTDLQGNVLASIDRVQGHLGAMTLNPEDGRVYASLECKDDEIGANISKKLKVDQIERSSSVFYIAIIDVNKLDRIGMDPEKDGVMTTVCVREACEDYRAIVKQDGKELEHRYGCSGIDGVTFAPAIGKKSGKKYLYVAYGIYGDNGRTDNDYQVLLRYDVRRWGRYETPVTFGNIHEKGPKKPQEKYFVYTGNTRYGVQNMAYDPYTHRIYMAVYNGKKPQYPNYGLFAVDCSKKPFKAPLKGVGYEEDEQKQLTLAEDGLYDEASGVHGWYFKWGSTGICPLGDGWWLISENSKNKDKTNNCNARLYRWSGVPECPFEKSVR